MNLMRNDVGVVITNAVVSNESKNQEKNIFHFKKIFKKSGIFKKRKLEKRLLMRVMYSPGASLFRKKDLIDALYLVIYQFQNTMGIMV